MSIEMTCKVLNAGELAAILGLPRTTIYKWTKENKIPHFTIGKCIRYEKNIVAKILNGEIKVG